MGHKGFVAGGCFKNILKGEKVKDIDIFFESEVEYLEADKYFSEHDDYKLHYRNKKVKAYKHYDTGMVVELIHSRFSKPVDLINSFDFTLTKFAYYRVAVPIPDEEDVMITKITHHKDFFEHLQMNRLVIDNTMSFPVNTFERVLRYTKYGYKICKESKAKLIQAIKESPFNENDLSQSLYDGMD